MTRGRKRKDLTGLEFGKFTVIGFAYRKDKNVYWECKLVAKEHK